MPDNLSFTVVHLQKDLWDTRICFWKAFFSIRTCVEVHCGRKNGNIFCHKRKEIWLNFFLQASDCLKYFIWNQMVWECTVFPCFIFHFLQKKKKKVLQCKNTPVLFFGAYSSIELINSVCLFVCFLPANFFSMEPSFKNMAWQVIFSCRTCSRCSFR